VYYSYNLNYTCQATCPSPYYGFQGNKSCLTTCPATPNVTYYDDTNRKCVTVCPSNFYGADNRSCVACTSFNTQPAPLEVGETPLPGCAWVAARLALTTPMSLFRSALQPAQLTTTPILPTVSATLAEPVPPRQSLTTPTIRPLSASPAAPQTILQTPQPEDASSTVQLTTSPTKAPEPACLTVPQVSSGL